MEIHAFDQLAKPLGLETSNVGSHSSLYAAQSPCTILFRRHSVQVNQCVFVAHDLVRVRRFFLKPIPL